MNVAPDYIEPFEAWRVWHVVASAAAPRLRSVVKPTLWPAGHELRAECLRHRPFFRRRRPHDVPGESCQCGIYGTTLDRIEPYLQEALPADALAHAVGRVALWGTLIECERGYRAELAYPIEVSVVHDEELAASLAESYGIPVRVVESLTVDAFAAVA